MSILDSEMCLCARITERLAKDVGSDRYERFFARASRLVLSGDRLDVDVPNRFVADWIKRNFSEAIRQAAEREKGGPVQVHIRVLDPDSTDERSKIENRPSQREDGQRRESRDGEANTAEGRHGDGRAHAPRAELRRHPHAVPSSRPDAALGQRRRSERRHTLKTFLVGEANRLAYQAALRMAEGDADDFRVLFIHGSCGVGKTHLLRGIMQRRRELRPQQYLRYVTGEQFTNEYIAALRSNKMEAFRAQLRSLDLLCIDDVHFLSSKQSTQAELLHTLKMIDLTGARLVLASDEHPQRIRNFTAQLTSRFLSGMVAHIDEPEHELRRRLATDFASRRKLRLSEPVLDALAHRFAGSPRELHGGILKLEVVQQLSGGVDGGGSGFASEVGLAVYRQAFSESPARPGKPVQASAVLECVCEHLQVDLSEVLGRSRHRRVVLARSLCAHLIRELTTLSYPEIAQRMSRPNHSTIITACQRVKGQIQRDERVSCGPQLPATSLRALVEELKRRVIRA